MAQKAVYFGEEVSVDRYTLHLQVRLQANHSRTRNTTFVTQPNLERSRARRT